MLGKPYILNPIEAKDDRIELVVDKKGILATEQVAILIAQVYESQSYIEITIFTVRKEHRKNGIGKCMIKNLKEFAKMHSIEQIVVHAIPYDFYDENAELLDINTLKDIYEKCGFVFLENKRKGYIDVCLYS